MQAIDRKRLLIQYIINSADVNIESLTYGQTIGHGLSK